MTEIDGFFLLTKLIKKSNKLMLERITKRVAQMEDRTQLESMVSEEEKQNASSVTGS